MLDVAVIGGGPAGTAAAIECARAGLHVVLLERHAQPHDKPGETLHPGVEPLLDRLGLGAAIRSAGFLRHLGIEVAWDAPARFVPYGGDASGPWRAFRHGGGDSTSSCSPRSRLPEARFGGARM